MKTGSKFVHAGLPVPSQGESFAESPVFASTYHLSGDVNSAEYQYARFGNPTWTALEAGLSELEGGETVIFPSGMAAITAILSALVVSGEKIILPADGYYATRAFAESFLIPNGIKIEFVKTTKVANHDFTGVKLVLLETPSNPLLDCIDIAEIAQKIHSCGGVLAIDNTTATIHSQQPLDLGADISMCADTKSLNGHSDVVFGHVSSNESALIEKIRLWRKLSGSIPGPMETWLVHRGLATMDVRMVRMVQNAQVLAELLDTHPKVKSVRYPGLKHDPSYEIASKQMAHYGFMLSFDLGSQQAADLFLEKSQLVFEATSFGGLHTMAERRARWGTDDVSPGLIRLSVGCEHIDDLIKDMINALEG
ncbi:cystathionine gamma-lyase [Aestuariibacter salexigens]|uniref:cystathionine gamma-lyase n=1 Tax=Aestuariibacter salexigens TaxID=226010 RepID=UPI001F0AE1A2|nr:cystathionine gamma-lyase [Aestuariibacter salexigens]